ncbi:DUF4105 domain-containing protein [Myxococcus sp. CA033]|uniref:lipoprotein N-acyltransferase Lnb domain-containing protein n=1 Tax=Myxococcus sp. CA033 TaxID=2741516 RepID=UPI00157AE09A|nr:DUF4105 domain-containing protein [Myxococcus sp. CA033]NTX35583.1 DUF4105 domain-containing protein [Myxococcus sp. CA033]
MGRLATLPLLLGLLWSTPLLAATAEDFGAQPEALRIQVVTFGPGTYVQERFGHSALWVEDTRLGEVALYSYGVTSHGPAAEVRYLLERPTYWAARLSVEHSFFLYRARGRSIFLQELDLSVEQRRRLLARLERDVNPETREYAYDPLRGNCATRLRDALDDALGGALHARLAGPAALTHREHLRRYTRDTPLFQWALMLWLNDDVDAPMTRWEEAAFPLELARALAEFSFMSELGTSTPLVRRSHDEHLTTTIPPPLAPGPTSLTRGLLALLVAGVMVLLAVPRAHTHRCAFQITFGLYHAFIGATLGTAGAIGFVLMLGSEHPYFGLNENQWLAHPLSLALLPLGLGIAWGNERAERRARHCVGVLALGSLLAVLLKLSPTSHQDTLEPMTVLLAANIGLALVHVKRWRAPQTLTHRRGASLRPEPHPPGDSTRAATLHSPR